MQTRFPIVGVFLSLFVATAGFTQQVSPLITQPINEGQLTTLRGNVHPLAQPQFDVGIAAPDMSLQRMLLVLKRSPQQEFGLRKLLDDQQDKASPNYHKWLTPDEFGVQFGPSDQDVQLITGWLQSHGFQVNRVAHGRSVIEFSGVESQVEGAFHTQIHAYMVNGQQHWANASDPQIPAALAPAVAGVLSLNNFPAQPMLQVAGAMSRDKSSGQVTPVKPLTTFSGNCGVQNNCYGVGPYDFATIYNVAPLWNATPSIDGTGQTIAIVGETDINPQDVADFRNYFGLPALTLNVIHDGPAPGILCSNFSCEETESDLDVEWSGAVAKGASIDFVVSQSTETTAGIDLSALYIIDNNLAPVMSESYGRCELGLGTAGNQGKNAMWEQAAAQGITVMISAGDNGAAGCDNFDLPGPAQFGLQVSGFASTPFNVAVGGTDFYDLTNASLYWNPTNASTTQASAIKYIPETTWDDSCTNPVFGTLFGFTNSAEANCNNPQLINSGFVNVVGGSGGKSNCTNSDGQHPSTCAVGYPKPSWQVAPGVPSDGVRDIPDVSLFAASGSPSGSFYIICQADQVSGSCNPANQNTQFFGVGGTSASAPAFAGIMALVNQAVPTPHGQGNANYVLYKLAAAQNGSLCNSSNGSGASCVFNDVTTGINAMPCQAGSPNCTVQTPGHAYGILNGYTTGVGYDLATGLGSVNVNNLVTMWNSVAFRSSTTTLALVPTSNINHGQSVSVSINVTPSSGTGTPSGDVSLLTSTGVSVDGFTLANGVVSGTTDLLPGGSYTVVAHYAGDSNFGGSDSAPVSVTVKKENSNPQIELVTFDWQGNLLSSNATTAVYGSPYLLRVDVFGSSGTACLPSPLGESACPSGNVTLTDNGNPLDAGTFLLNSSGFTEDQAVDFAGGSNSVKAQYAGDSSFNASSATTTYNVTPALTTINSPSVSAFQVGSPFTAQATIQSKSFGVAPTGTVTFFANGNPVSGTISYSSAGGSASSPTATLSASFNSAASALNAAGSYTITVSYSGDANYGPSTSSGTIISVKYPLPFMSISTPSTTVAAGSSVTISVIVDTSLKNVPVPTGSVPFFDWTTGVPVSGTETYSTTTDSNGNVALQASMTFVPAASASFAASYSGDSNYPSTSGGGLANVTVTGSDFVLVPQTASFLAVRGEGGGDLIFVEGQSNYNGTINFTPSSCSGLPHESTCTWAPASVTGSGYAGLEVLTALPHSLPGNLHGNSRSKVYPLALAMPFAAVLLVSIPRRRGWRRLSLFLLAVTLLLGPACGSGSGGGGGGGGSSDPGTPVGSYPITVTAISGTGASAITHVITLTLVVQ